jgi:hypothetical protein
MFAPLALSAPVAACICCGQHNPPLALPAPAPAAPAAVAVLPVWRSAAELARAYAVLALGEQRAATLPQLERICQLLTSTTLQEAERARAVAALRAGLTKAEASRWLDRLIPAVRRRREHRNRVCLLAPLAAAA